MFKRFSTSTFFCVYMDEQFKGLYEMNFIKNIMFVSYLKNKGVRRICLILSFILVFYSIFKPCFNLYIGYVNEKYNNFYEFNLDLYNTLQIAKVDDYPILKKIKSGAKAKCAWEFLEKHNFTELESYLVFGYKDIINDTWCSLHDITCNKFKLIADEPIHLECGTLEYFDIAVLITVILFSMFVAFYIPFILFVIIKIVYYKIVAKIIKWVKDGFDESSKLKNTNIK